jgi:hypothetical protein
MNVGEGIILLDLLFHALQLFLILRSHRNLEKENNDFGILLIRNSFNKYITSYISVEFIGQPASLSQSVDGKNKIYNIMRHLCISGFEIVLLES